MTFTLERAKCSHVPCTADKQMLGCSYGSSVGCLASHWLAQGHL